MSTLPKLEQYKLFYVQLSSGEATETATKKLSRKKPQLEDNILDNVELTAIK